MDGTREEWNHRRNLQPESRSNDPRSVRDHRLEQLNRIGQLRWEADKIAHCLVREQKRLDRKGRIVGSFERSLRV